MLLLRPLFRRHGTNFVFDPDGIYSYQTIEVGDDVFIGPCAIFQASKSSIVIGNKVMFGPHVTIMGGDHNISVIGKSMFDVKVKRSEDDLNVIISDDVWIGTGAIILKGVMVGEGSVIGAGSVVTRNIPPYCVAAGNPAKVFRYRFSDIELARHLAKVGSKLEFEEVIRRRHQHYHLDRHSLVDDYEWQTK